MVGDDHVGFCKCKYNMGDDMIENLVVIPLVFASLLSSALTWLTLNGYRGLGLVDRSTKKDHPKHNHERPVPRGGGIPIFFSLLVVVALFMGFDRQMGGIFLGGGILLILGVLDDVFDLSPYLRLGLGMVAAGVVVMSGIKIRYVSNPFGEGVINLGGWWGEVLTGLWILWGMNFVNMGAKGLDGQLPGVVVIAASVMGSLSFRFVNDVTAWPSAFLAFALAGAYLGFLGFNVYPQKIMPGWGGGSLAGYFLAVIAILSGAKLATALIVLGVPFCDVVYAIVRRLYHKRSPVWGDDKHLHHFLLKLGWSKRKVAAFYWLVTAGLGGLALNLSSEAKVYAMILIGVSVGGGLLWLNYLISLSRQE